MSPHHLPRPRPGHGVIINALPPDDWFGRYGTVILLTVATIPLAVLVARLLVRWRERAGLPRGEARRRSWGEVGLVHGTVPWLWLTMLPEGPSGDRALSLVPLRDLATMPRYQVLGNLLVLAALGLCGPLRFRALAGVTRVLLAAGAVSTLIEVSQYVLALGRVASVDDVLLNTAGATLAALIGRPLWRRRSGQSGLTSNSKARSSRCGRPKRSSPYGNGLSSPVRR